MLRIPALAGRSSLTLAALALAACSDAPLAPDAATPSNRPSLAAAPTPTSWITPPAGMIQGNIWFTTTGSSNTYIPGVTVRYVTDKATTDITDDAFGDITALDGIIFGFMPISTSYKAEVVNVPIGYLRPTAIVTGKVKGPSGSPYVEFGGVALSPKVQVRVNFLNMQKQLVPGGTVVVTAPGWDLIYTITDGGAGDLTPLGAQAPADGMVTVYAPAYGIGEWKVCETGAPAGYLLTEPSCQSMKVQATKMTHTFSLLHQGGIIAPPPPAPM